MGKKAIVLKTFNRPKLLESCLKSIFTANLIDDFLIIVLRQTGNDEVKEIIERYRDRFVSVIETKPIGASIDAFITNNTMLGYTIAFEFWKVDYVLSVEEDVVLSGDSLHFVDSIFNRYSNDTKFRGVNLGSQIPYDSANRETYSLTRFGIHGPAGMITQKTWKRVNKKNILKNDSVIFDAQLEFLLKSGFMVVPNCSRFIDLGVQSARTGETYSLSNSQVDDPVKRYFFGLRDSFIGENTYYGNFWRRDITPIWRKDCWLYKSRHNSLFNAKALIYPILHGKMGHFYLQIRRKYLARARVRM